MQTITSKDQTPIAFDVTGSGPALILITGALNYSSFGSVSDLAPLLQDAFTVYAYDRRGRNQSGDTPPYHIDREIEDLSALIDHAGGKAFLYGHSSGGALAFLATGKLPEKIIATAVYEPAYSPGLKADLTTRLFMLQNQHLLRQGDNLGLVTRFMRYVGMNESLIQSILNPPTGPILVAMAGTLLYEARILLAVRPFLKKHARNIRTPMFFLAGDKSFSNTVENMRHFVEAVPGSSSQVIHGQDHTIDASRRS